MGTQLMAVYNQNAAAYEHTYFVGMNIGQLEIIQITATTITGVCSCGNVLSRGLAAFKARPPFSCKECAKEARAIEAVRSSTALSIRDYDAIESLMLKEVGNEILTSHEKDVLKEHRAKAIIKSRTKKAKSA